ncbi:UV protection protein [Escherichia coli]|uniref:UV protection protein n=1 Tax=Escherichia coli TaxID=562 RepID=A0AB73RL88_ECOLX|nr:UV protection protein [Citrobacter freundii]EFJ97677.1 hypothetical protein HMPREF9540_02258 [Escherichia coli MS 115-1]KXL36518.1 UV protection protein [Escherichia coli]PNP35888.1 UV protection protein [Citrobacter amalonaticus]PUY91372.1 UV protection protein [Cronobacter sakazakii]QEY81751.1 UV protection protein [Klebsiella quasipneumoniae]
MRILRNAIGLKWIVKAVVIPSSITDASDLPSLFDEQPTRRISETLMKVMDRFNKELFLVIEGISRIP